MARPPLDLRLAIAAPTAWLGSFAVWAVGPSVVVVIAVTGSCASGLVFLRSSPRRALGVGRPVWPIAAFALVALVAGVLTASLSITARSVPGELIGRTIPLTMEITSGSKPVASTFSWQSDRIRIHARIRASNDWTLNSPAAVFADDRWAEIPIGATVSTRGKIVPSNGPLNVSPLVATSGAPRIESGPGPIQSTMNRLRDGLRRATAARDPDGASLVAGLAIGDESGQSPALSDSMLRSGLSHLTAVSGGNTAIVLILVLGLARVFPTPIWFQAGSGGIALLGYLILVGPQPSVLRATVMGAVVLVGLARGGFVAGLPVLSLAAFGLLLLDPSLAVSLGFGLSVAATAGLLLLAPAVRRGIVAIPILDRLPRWLCDALAVTLSAQFATAPILLAVGNDISLAAVPANLLVAPVVAPITIAGLLAAVSSLLAPAVAIGIAWPATFLGEWIAYVATLTSSWEWATVGRIGGVAIVVSSFFAVGLLGIRGWLRKYVGFHVGKHLGERALPRVPLVSMRTFAVVSSGCAILLMACLALLRPTERDWRVVACDVGQGSATLVRSGSAVILVDAGPQDGGISECLSHAGVTELNAVAITHLHADHADGLADVLADVPVQSIFATSAHLNRDRWRELDQRSGDSLQPRVLEAGQRLEVPGLTGEILWPHKGHPASAAGMNNGSLVIKFRWDDGFTLLVTGDVETEAQQAIVSKQPTTDPIDVVTVPHHGSPNLEPAFARQFSPSVALVSVGEDNEYGHPSEQSLKSFESAGATLFRTDELGSLKLAWHEGQVWIDSL